MTLSPRAACRALLIAVACGATFTASAGAASRVNAASGTVLSAVPLKRSLWIPGTTARAFKLTYVSTDQLGRRALSTGELFLPKGSAPAKKPRSASIRWRRSSRPPMALPATT